MNYSFKPVSHGKHNNIHFKFTITYQKIVIVKALVVGFFDTENAYIIGLNLKGLPSELFNYDEFYKVIRKNLMEYDLDLCVLDKLSFGNTEELLTYLKNKKLCV